VPPTDEPSAARLIAALRALPLHVDRVACTTADLPVPSYPEGARPTSTVTLTGAGTAGSGEHVGWTRAAHARFCTDAPAGTPHGRWTLGGWVDELHRLTAEPYARAALEAAALDLALRQQSHTLFTLAACAPRPVRYVVSFDRRADPAAEGHRLRRHAPGVELKVDADPAWADAVYAALAALGRVAVLDFKDSGTVADHERAHRQLPTALLEDPLPASWSPAVRARVSFDARVRTAADIAALPVRPAAVNVKPARMGGVLAALHAIAACQAAGIAVYLGGMFETGPGRRQLQALAALFAPDGPNDVAPIGVGETAPAWPERLVVDARGAGFGAMPVA
jgi:L-alanine-DL-glutamate epimerase-like enolase superfamily enzyme